MPADEPSSPAPSYTADGESPGDASLRAIRDAVEAWRRAQATGAGRAMPPRSGAFETWSGLVVPDVLTPADAPVDYLRDLGMPGDYPFTRGVQPTMYRSRLWTMRLAAGHGTPEQTNERFRFLLGQGQTGLSVVFDFPTLTGLDSDSPRSLGEVGMCGVAVDTLRDMDALFRGIALDQVTTSLAIDGPAIVLLGFYVALADERGIPRGALGGTVQGDWLQALIAHHTALVPPRAALRLVTDMIAFCARELPRWNPVSISGYAMREAGATAAQELAFTLADGLAYVESCLARGLAVDAFAGRLSFAFDVQNEFLEEIAKLRAARRLWARLMKERYQATEAASLKLRAHARTSGVSLTAQQPRTNIARVALQAMAAVLGGVQSLHTSSLDEPYALPTEDAVTVALRTQQIIAEESGVAGAVDPLGGSYHVEWLTGRLEQEAMDHIERIDALGGMVAAIEQGYPQREIAAASYRLQRQVEQGQRVVIGLNRHDDPSARSDVPTVPVDDEMQRRQVASLRQVKASRDAARVAACLERVRSAARGTDNLMEPIIEAARAHCTEQELCDVLREVLGTYDDLGG